MHRRLSIPNEPYPLFHQRTHINSISIPSIRSDDPNFPHLPHTHETLIDRLRNVRLEHHRLLDLVHDRLGLMERPAVKRDINSARYELVELLHHVRVFFEIDDFCPGFVAREGEAGGHGVDADDALGAFEEGPANGALANGTQTLQPRMSLSCIEDDNNEK